MSVNFAAGCRLYSILCECRLIPCNFVFNIRFIMHCTSPPLLNQLNFLLNLTYLALSMFSPELWKSCKYQQRPIVCWQNRKKWERCYLLTIVQFVMVDCDRHCVLWVGGEHLASKESQFNHQSITERPLRRESIASFLSKGTFPPQSLSLHTVPHCQPTSDFF